MKVTGSIALYRTSRLDGTKDLLVARHNLIVYQSADAIARMADPNRNFAVRYMYFEFSNATSAPAAADVEDDVDLFNALVAPEDYLRVPIIASPAYSVSAGDESKFSGNEVTFFASTGAAPTVGGSVVGEVNGEVFGTGSEIGAAGLIISDGTKANDMLHSRVIITPGPVVKSADYDFDLHWKLKFDPTT